MHFNQNLELLELVLSDEKMEKGKQGGEHLKLKIFKLIL